VPGALRDGGRELLLAIEEISPSSARMDRVTRRRGYQSHVSEYWIVDVDARIVEGGARGTTGLKLRATSSHGRHRARRRSSAWLSRHCSPSWRP